MNALYLPKKELHQYLVGSRVGRNNRQNAYYRFWFDDKYESNFLPSWLRYNIIFIV